MRNGKVSSHNGKATSQLDEWAEHLTALVTAAAQRAIEEGGLDLPDPAAARPATVAPADPGPPRLADTTADDIREAVAMGLAHLQDPDLRQYTPAQVAAALDSAFPQKSGPPAAEWLDWLRQRVAQLSLGMTRLEDDTGPRPPGPLLFRAYHGLLRGAFTTRRFVLTTAGVEYLP